MIKETKHRIKISETEFLKKLGKLLGEIIGRKSYIDEKTGRINDFPDYILTEYDEYLESVFQPAGNIMNIYEQLEFIPIFASKFPLEKFYEKNGINNPKYLQYHFENHFLKISTIFDLCVILTSEIYRLGIPAKLINLQSLKENKHTKETNSVKILKHFEKSIQNIKKIRNLISHRGQFDDKEIDNIFTYFYLSDPLTNEKPMFSKDILKMRMQDITAEKVALMKKNNQTIFLIIEKLFNESLEILEKTIEKIK